MTDEKPTCRACQNPLSEYPMGEKNSYRLVACRACGSVFTQPWPAPEVIDTFYGEIQPEIVHITNHLGQIQEAKRRIMKMTRQYEGRSFLDISCRQGYGVIASKEMGFQQAVGIDSHSFFVAFAKDKYDPHLFEHVTLQDYAARGQKADIIYCMESFCEQPDLENYTAALAKVLAPGGKAYIQEPDGNHFRLPSSFTNWGFVYPPMNFFYPSRRGIESLLNRHGLKIEKKFFSWSPFLRLIVSHK